MKDKKKLTYIIIIVFLLIFCIVFCVLKRNTVKFSLVDNEIMIVDYGTEFFDPGFIANNGFGKEINEYVEINGYVNTLVPGTYRINYYLDYNNVKRNLERVVIVRDIKINDLEIKLNGNEEVYLLKGSTYSEEGASVYNKLDNSLFNKGNVSVTNNIDENSVGEYQVNYNLTYKDENTTITRKVIVFDVNYNITPEDLTPNEVNIELELNNNITSIKLPNGNISNNKIVNYTVTSNGKYEFIITLTNNQVFNKIIEIDNIIPNYVCTGEITSTGTKIILTPNENKEYKWIINNETITGTNIFAKEKIITSAKVQINYDNNKSYIVNCNITDKLVYHFKYDEKNTKPYMKCDTYTASDKVRLDSILKQVVSEAGYGTRAGVVAAARFLVGGLDYKVYYQGPKKGLIEVGSYQKVGLNIGQKDAWGCTVSGYVRGMDCTNFVSWAFYQNGIKDNVYKNNYKPVRDVINQVRVGDLLYTPCTASVCKNDTKTDHVGIVIGIDDNNIYVAEATTGNINAIVVTKLNKHNMPSRGKFSVVYFYKYSSDGNVTNMWMAE